MKNMGLKLKLGLIMNLSLVVKAQQIASTSDQALKNCGMFKFHKKKYLKGVRDFYAYREVRIKNSTISDKTAYFNLKLWNSPKLPPGFEGRFEHERSLKTVRYRWFWCFEIFALAYRSVCRRWIHRILQNHVGHFGNNFGELILDLTSAHF